MEAIIGRKREQMLLAEYCASHKAEFIAVYGRRRVGKTFLVKNFFRNEFAFYMTGIFEGSLADQLANFAVRLSLHSGQRQAIPASWFEAFSMLQTYLDGVDKAKQLVVFIDELPWLDTPNSRFMKALELFWNSWGSTCTRLKFIVCGSATTWMLSKIIGDRGGLHNRVTHRIYLRSFSLSETEDYLKANGFVYNRQQIIDVYMIVGGIPFYLSMLRPSLGVEQNVDQLFFADDAPLRDEYTLLWRSLFKDAGKYTRVVELLAKHGKGLTKAEIVKALKATDNGSFTEVLHNLVSCDFLRRFSAFGKKERDMMYQLTDPYTLFYIRFVKNDNHTDHHKWTNMMLQGAQNAWKGYAFEQVCLRHIDQLKYGLGVSGMLTTVCSWYCAPGKQIEAEEPHKGGQIDLLIDRADGIINLCEMKYGSRPFAITSAYAKEMDDRRELFRSITHTKKALHLTIVTPHGLAQNANTGAVQSQITADHLFLPPE
ncbi:MAG: ATP-binding protein [Sodaliphilus sp.]